MSELAVLIGSVAFLVTAVGGAISAIVWAYRRKP